MKPKRRLLTAVVKSSPQQHQILDPNTGRITTHLAYIGEMQFTAKPKQDRVILCTSLDSVWVGSSVFVAYHSGMEKYQHQTYVATSNHENCSGQFHYINGQPA